MVYTLRLSLAPHSLGFWLQFGFGEQFIHTKCVMGPVAARKMYECVYLLNVFCFCHVAASHHRLHTWVAGASETP